MAEDAANPKRAIDLGSVDAAVLASGNGRARLRLYLSVEQLETMLAAARGDAEKRGVTQCNAEKRDATKRDAASGNAVPPFAPSPFSPHTPHITPTQHSPSGAAVMRARDDRASVWVSEGTRAWKAWESWWRQARAGRAIPVTKRAIDGKTHTGWWFVSLFPPSQAVEFDESEKISEGANQ